MTVELALFTSGITPAGDDSPIQGTDQFGTDPRDRTHEEEGRNKGRERKGRRKAGKAANWRKSTVIG
jgi:hypothetical protein